MRPRALPLHWLGGRPSEVDIECASFSTHRRMISVYSSSLTCTESRLLAVQAVEVLLQAGASVNALDEQHAGALHAAARSGSLPILDRLLEAGADPLAVNANGETMLQVAALGGCWALTQRVLEKGGDVGARSHDGRTVLHYAALGKNQDLIGWMDSCEDVHLLSMVTIHFSVKQMEEGSARVIC